MDNRIDLDYILYYATSIRASLVKGYKPITAEVQRLSQLAQEIEREFDGKWQEWCEQLAAPCQISVKLDTVPRDLAILTRYF